MTKEASYKRKSPGYWTEKTVLFELEITIEELGHFPTQKELAKLNKGDLAASTSKFGGLNRFRDVLGYTQLRKPDGYWKEETIITELKYVIEKLNRFPKQTELKEMKKHDLSIAISKHGGINHFRDKMDFERLYKPDGYWTEDIIINELNSTTRRLGHFPTYSELTSMKKKTLLSAIAQHNGINFYREKLEYELTQKPAGYWNDETVINELNLLIEELGRFPSQTELIRLSRNDLLGAIHKYGGLTYFKEKTGFTISMQEKYKSELSLYLSKRGRKSEQLIREIITEWSNIHGKPSPDFNVKLSKGNVIEFVCDFDKKVGIDVTNTKASRNTAFSTISKKWRHKDYRLYLDELWIVVFTDVLSSEDYNELNKNSPNNVKIFSIEGFLDEIDHSIERCNKNEIDKLQSCTFHNKEEILKV